MSELNWLDIWMKQSKVFFDSVDKRFFVNPEDHLDKIHQWMETMQQQWQVMQTPSTSKKQQDYWKQLSSLCQQAMELTMNEWIKRMKTDSPVKSSEDLYALWLKSCETEYQKAMQGKAFQQAYGAWINETMKFWNATAK